MTPRSRQALRRWLVAGTVAVLAGCATPPDRVATPPDPGGVLPDRGPVRPDPGSALPDPGSATPEEGPLLVDPSPLKEPPAVELERGKASWYGRRFHGRRTASGERFDMHDLTAAHPTLPFGTRVLVRNLRNGREVVVRINDRGPFVKRRIIDLSKAAAEMLGLVHAGEAQVVLFGL